MIVLSTTKGSPYLHSELFLILLLICFYCTQDPICITLELTYFLPRLSFLHCALCFFQSARWLINNTCNNLKCKTLKPNPNTHNVGSHTHVHVHMHVLCAYTSALRSQPSCTNILSCIQVPVSLSNRTSEPFYMQLHARETIYTYLCMCMCRHVPCPRAVCIHMTDVTTSHYVLG